MCPMDDLVCGSLSTLSLAPPSSRSVVTNSGLELSAKMPPGHVCFYNIDVQTTRESDGIFRTLGFVNDEWMTMFQIDDTKTHSDSFEAHIIAVTSPTTFKDYDILAPTCSQADNDCIRNVREKGRDFFVSEFQKDGSRLEAVYLALVNNAASDTAMFSGSLQRVPSQSSTLTLMFVSACWIVLTAFAITKIAGTAT
jgi:hypothetical protein